MGKLELYTPVGRERLHCGYATGTCAAAAVAGAATLLPEGATPSAMHIDTPIGVRVEAELLEHAAGDGWAACAVRKDGGGDPDVTDGALICARVERSAQLGIAIDGGQGVGQVIRPGLGQPMGEAAINSTPRRVIQEQPETTAARVGYADGLRAMISVSTGETLAGRAPNPWLGIRGGISILGTSDVVRPIDEAALLGSLYLEMDQQKAAGVWDIVVTPGNYDEAFAQGRLGFSPARWCTCSNYIGTAIGHATGMGFRSVLLVGHLDKLIKASTGYMNTHSRVTNARWGTLAIRVVLAGGDWAPIKAPFDSLTIDAGVELLGGAGLLEPVMDSIAGELDAQLRQRAGPGLVIGDIFLSNQYETLGKAPGTEGLLALHRAQEIKTMVHFIGVDPRAEDLITVWEAKLLGEVDVIIYAGSLINPALLNCKRESCAVYDSVSMTPGQVIEVMRDTEARGGMTVRLHAGDPSLYGAIREQMGELDKLGTGYDVTPSVSFLFGTAAALCAECTLSGVSQSAITIRMAGHTSVPRGEELCKMASHDCTMVLFLPTELLGDVEQELTAGGYAPGTPAAIVYKITWPKRRVYRCAVSTLAKTARKNQVAKTALITIGYFLGDDYEWSEPYDPTLACEFREASK